MRLTVLALAMLPMAAFAQNTTLPAPTEPVAQGQSCPAGTAWSDAAGACAAVTEAATPANGKSGCGYSAAREVTS
ncbi:hypothetical protein [Yoonia sp.]|uniref:hypothetical protein n=1 Tax=Yoonia sp. TaxID=2212373 RepID=UPI003975CCBB